MFIGYSFIESAAIRIGDEILEVAGWGDYILNGVNSADLTATLATYPVNHTEVNKKHHIFEILVQGDERIHISSFKDWVSVKIVEASNKNFNGSVGLMGDYATGKKMARDGHTIMEDPNVLGQEWQVLSSEPKLFMASRVPQSPDLCILPDPTAQQRRLGETIAHSVAAEACAKSHGDEYGISNCIFDGKFSSLRCFS